MDVFSSGDPVKVYIDIYIVNIGEISVTDMVCKELWLTGEDYEKKYETIFTTSAGSALINSYLQITDQLQLEQDDWLVNQS